MPAQSKLELDSSEAVMTKILVPLDGSDLAEAALPLAERLAAGLDAEVLLVAVGELPETSAEAREVSTALSKMLAKASKTVSRPVRQRVEPAGDPVRGILHAAEEEDVDLIVMSTHGRGWLGELTQGSVANGLLRSGRFPLTLVRPDGADQGSDMPPPLI
jgi:nucleotide-binding universal stress UspA family protein